MAKQLQKPIRVAMVHYRDSAIVGGSLRVGETIANQVDPDRIAAEMVFAYGGPGPVTENARVPCHFLGSRGPKDLPAWLRARAFFKEMRPDIIHFQDAVVWLRTALAGTPYSKVVHVHGRHQIRPKGEQGGAYKTHPFKASRLMQTFLKATDAQVCINNGARAALLELGWIKAETSYVVYNSVDVSRFTALPDRMKARAELGLPADALLLGMICRLVWEKRMRGLILSSRAFAQSMARRDLWRRSAKDDLQRECEARGLANRIHFIDPQDDVVPVYAALDAYAFLSPYEPFGLVLAEAMAAGVPVFGLQGDGEYNEPEYPLLGNDAADLLPLRRAGDYGLEVPQRLLDQLAVKLAYYGARPESCRGMIYRARRWVETCFNASIQAEAMTRVYENIFAGRDSSEARLAETYETRRLEAEASETAGRTKSALAANA